jgi:hypothetical protein
VAQVRKRSRLHGAALPDDGDPVAQRLDLGEDVAGQQDGPPALALFLDAVAEDRLHQRVETRGGLVQQEQLDVGGERRD